MTTTELETVVEVDPGTYFAEHPEFEDCRKEGHAWSRFEPRGASFLVENEGQANEVWMKERQCGECGQVHVKRWDRFGNELTDGRTYPEGYVLKGERMPLRGNLWQRDFETARQARQARRRTWREAQAAKPKRKPVRRAA